MLLTALLALVGWGVGYWSTLRRDRLSKKRDLRTQYLIEAYRRAGIGRKLINKYVSMGT